MGEAESTKKDREPWALKDALIAIPFLASALAMTWEVGYFAEIRGGAFGLFSIAEHITYALQVLPIALLYVSVGAVGLMSDRIFKMHPVEMRTEFGRRIQRFLQKTQKGAVVLGMGVGLVLAYRRAPQFDATTAVLALIAIGYFALTSLIPIHILKTPFSICALILATFYISFGVGLSSAKSQIASPFPLNIVRIGEKGKDNQIEMKVRILRTGERGILYFDPVVQSYGLQPWDTIKSVSWGSIAQ